MRFFYSLIKTGVNLTLNKQNHAYHPTFVTHEFL